MVRLSVPLSVRRRPPPADLHQPTALRREIHIVSLICTLASIVLLAVSLGLRGWATGKGKHCQYTYGLLSVKEVHNSIPTVHGLTHYYNVAQQIIVSCILSISSLTIITSFVAMVVSAGFPRERLEFLRHYSVFNVVSLLCIVLIGGLWVWVTETLPQKGKTNSCKEDTDIVIKFGYAYYMAMGSGLLVLLAASLNLLRARTLAERRRIHQRRLYNNTAEASIYNRLSSTAVNETSETETDFSDYEQLSPPPPYAP